MVFYTCKEEGNLSNRKGRNMKLLNVETIEALDNQTAALLETKYELTKAADAAEAKAQKTQALVDIMEKAPYCYTNEEAEALYVQHVLTVDHLNAVKAKLEEVSAMLEKLENIVNEMKEFNEYWESRD